MRKLSIRAVVVSLAVVLAPSAAPAYATTVAFPSAQSSVVSSYGFYVDGDYKNQVGHFWSADLGHLIRQTISGPVQVDGASLELDVADNVLDVQAHVDWQLEINGVPVGTFTVVKGQKTVSLNAAFPVIPGPSYTVTLRVTNVVAEGEGAISFWWTGAKKHALTLHMTDCSVGGLQGGPTVLGSDKDMSGPASGAAHGLEGSAGAAAPVVHEAGCAAAFAGV